MPRSSRAETDIVTALLFSFELFQQTSFESDNKIISLSTDGRQSFTLPGVNIETYVQSARDQVARDTITINAIAIEKEPLERVDPFSPAPVINSFDIVEESLTDYLQRNIITGPNSMLTPASNFKSYSDVFKKQISVMFNGCIS